MTLCAPDVENREELWREYSGEEETQDVAVVGKKVGNY